MRSFYSQPCSHSVHEAEEPPSPPAEGLGWGPAQEPAQGPRERQGTRAEGGPDLVCGGRGTVWRVVLVGMAQRMDCWARNAAGESPPLPGSLPPRLKVPVAHSSSRAQASPSSGRTRTHATLEAGPWFQRVSSRVVQQFQLSYAAWCTAPPCPRSPCVAEGSRGPTATSCRGRKGDSEEACDVTEVTQQIKGENERTRVHNSHLRLFPLFIAAFCVQGPRRCQNSP